MASVITKKSRASILKNDYSSVERDKIKNTILNKVRFELPKELGVNGAIDAVLNQGNYSHYNEFVSFLKDNYLDDKDLERIISEAHTSLQVLDDTFVLLVEALISIDWLDRSDFINIQFSKFFIDLLLMHNKYASMGVKKLISYWVPKDTEIFLWENGHPVEKVLKRLTVIHDILSQLLSIIPMIYDLVLEAIEQRFPYYKKPPHVMAGYLHNILWLLEYKPGLNKDIFSLIFRKLIFIDICAPRNDIEDAEEDDDVVEDDDDDMLSLDEDSMKQKVDNENEAKNITMKLPIAETLDICMAKLLEYLHKIASPSVNSSIKTDVTEFFKILLICFDNDILPNHNTHHVQFLIFYFCSFKKIFVETFLSNLWKKAMNPNTCAPIRQSSIGYLASFLARSKFTSIDTLKIYLNQMCLWANEYIRRCDSISTNSSLRTNIVFFSVCQAIFYVIAFRSRDLAGDKKSLLFLQGLQLSALVTCNMNPLRVCQPAVATAFAGVTRAYQLAYCHTVLEKNARRKLATVYANETMLPEEVLETFFPFDPYLLKKSGKHITPIYLQYQASQAEEDPPIEYSGRRKREESLSGENGDDIDDFIVDKRQKLSEIARSQEKEMLFTYGLSPGFHF